MGHTHSAAHPPQQSLQSASPRRSLVHRHVHSGNCSSRRVSPRHFQLSQAENEPQRCPIRDPSRRLRHRRRHPIALHCSSHGVEVHGPKARDRSRQTMGGRGCARSSARVILPSLDCEASWLSIIIHPLDHHNPVHGYCIKLPSCCVHALVDQWSHRLRSPSRHPCNLSWLPTARHVRRRPHLWCSWRRGWSPTLRRRRHASLLGREEQLGWLQSLSPARSVVSWFVGDLYIIKRVHFIPGFSFWRYGQGFTRVG